MPTLVPVVAILAVVSSLAVGATVAMRAPDWLGRSFALGMVALAVESLTGALLASGVPALAHTALALHQVCGLLVPLPWVAFVLALLGPQQADRVLRAPGAVSIALVVATLLGAVAVALVRAFPAVPASPSEAFALATPMRYALVWPLVWSVGIVAAVEHCLRHGGRQTRWRMRYLALGLGGMFVARFLLNSQMLLTGVVTHSQLAVEAATIFIGNLSVTVSLLRRPQPGMDVTVSRKALCRSVTVFVLGGYVFVVGVVAWLLDWLAIPEAAFWSTAVAFVVALAVAAAALSDELQWRLSRFIGRHVYHSKYDYRDQWRLFTKRLGSLLTVEELAPQLLRTVADAVGTTRGVLYLADGEDGRYRLATALTVAHAPAILEADDALVALARQRSAVALLRGRDEPGEARIGSWAAFTDDGALVPVMWRGTLSAIIVLGPERTGAAYEVEDVEFLSTVAEQAAGAIATAKLSETLARSLEFESFHRLTSFVVHDVKNAVSGLSLLTQNALRHFDNPEFQRDAVRTLSKTVERMQQLLGRLTLPRGDQLCDMAEVDLRHLMAEAAATVLDGARVSVVTDLRPVPLIVAEPAAIERVLHTLLTNALEAMEQGGRITLRTERCGDRVVAVVADTGCGIPAEFMRRSLFVPFRSTKKGGWGIGLYQAREIVLAHGGQIHIESEEGAGTTITLEFEPVPVLGTPVAGAAR